MYSLCPLLLVVDDDPSLLHPLQVNLEADGFEVLTAVTAAEALESLQRRLPDLAIVDLLLPDLHGFELCKKMKSYFDVPIIVLSAVGTEESIIAGLNLYAEDYIVKPFSYRELLARIGRVLKRTQHVRPPELVVIDERLRIDFLKHTTYVEEREVRLTPTESRLLSALARHPNRVVTSEALLQAAWPEDPVDLNRLWVNIERLRAKVERNPRTPQRIVTERGVGYKLCVLASPVSGSEQGALGAPSL